jgi:hypothetical protein
MSKAKKKKAKKRAAGKAPRKVTITTRVKKRVVVRNPKKAKKRKAPARKPTTITVRTNKGKKKHARAPNRRWFDRVLASPLGRKHAHDKMRASLSPAWCRMPTSRREREVRKLERGTPRQRRAAVAIAKAEQARADGPPRVRNPRMTDDQARAEYERTHWGERGKQRIVRRGAADPRYGTATKLGKLVAVVYETKKGGDAGLTEYVHDFEGRRPDLVYNDGGLLIAGGDYVIREGGIDG